MLKTNLKKGLDSLTSTKWSVAKDGERSIQRAESILKRVGEEGVDGSVVRRITSDLLQEGKSPSTVNRYLSALSALIKEAEAMGLGSSVRVPRLKEPKSKDRVVTREEEASLLKALENQADRDLTVFLLDTGARMGEAYGPFLLTEGGAVFEDTKNGTDRRVPLTARARGAAERGWEGRPRSSFEKAFRSAAPEGVSPHTLRHTCASRLLAKGVQLPVIQRWLGHSAITTTMRYAHLEQGALDSVVALLETEED